LGKLSGCSLKSQQIYPTDLNDTPWLNIRTYLPAAAKVGRPREHGLRMILNGIFDVLQCGCSWRMLPHELHLGKQFIDSQSSKTVEGGLEGGIDAGMKITSRKRHTLMDTFGLIHKSSSDRWNCTRS